MIKPPPDAHPDSIILTFHVPKEQAGLRLDRFLSLRIPRLSRTRANAIARACARFPDGRRRRPSDRVREGETVWIVRPPMNEPVTPRFYGVLHEDDDVLVVDKPAGLPMHPSASYHHNTLSKLLERDFPAAPPVYCHRLDRETSGVVVCAKHPRAEVALKRAFEQREVEKRYLAIVRGAMTADEGTIELPMRGADDDGPHVRMVVADDGLDARTGYRVEARRPAASRVALAPKTGRQHQLRVHLAALGHPIVGDKLYGPEGATPFLEIIEAGWSDALLARLAHPRHALHAAAIALPHPRGGVLEAVSPLPWDLERLWTQADDALAGAPVCTLDELNRPPRR